MKKIYLYRAVFPLSVILLVGPPLLWTCQRVFARLQTNFAQEL